MADAPPPPPNQAQEDATTLLREVEERRQSMSTEEEPPELAAMRRLLAQFTPTEPEIDESELLPRDLGDLDDTNEVADAFWERATKEKMIWSKWPGSLWAACAKHNRSVLSLKVLDQRVTVEFEAERSRVLLAREIAMPASSSDTRRVAQFHEGYRALQWASSPYCLQLNGGDLREYFGKLTALKDCCATLRGESLIDDEDEVAKWASSNVGRAQLTVQPPDVLDCADYQRKMEAINCPPHVIVASYDPVKRKTTTLCRLPLKGAKAVADLYMDVLHEVPSPRDWLKAVCPEASWEFSVAAAACNVCSS
jgi:hypothetical protein